MKIQVLPVGPFQANCYLVWNPARQALIIDPGADAHVILDAVDSASLSVVSYLLTHGHVDHVSALADLYDKQPAPVAIHSDDLPWAFEPANRMPPFYPAPRPPPRIELPLTDLQEWNPAGFACRVIATPGHTSGSVCFYFPANKALFSGDTLFAGSVGRTDLPGGSSRRLQASLAKLAALPPDTVIYSGHGPDTTIEEERRTNFFLRSLP